MTYPYRCDKRDRRRGSIHGHHPQRTTHTDPKPKIGECQYCQKFVIRIDFQGGASRYAATILIKEWP